MQPCIDVDTAVVEQTQKTGTMHHITPVLNQLAQGWALLAAA